MRKVSPAILCDFDGTVTLEEVSVTMLRRYCGPGWEEADRDLYEGRLSLRDTMKREFSLLRAPRAQLEEMARSIGVRDGFRELIAEANSHQTPLLILSEGLDFYIKAFLDRHGLDVKYMSNIARFTQDGIAIEYPHCDGRCSYCGMCKKKILEDFKKRGYTTVYVGDGISDRCPARHADILFARDGLLDFCKREELPFIKYADFHDIAAQLRRLFWQPPG